MRKMNFSIITIVFVLSLVLVHSVKAQVPLSQTGMVSVLDQDPSIDNAGNSDVTNKMRNALQAIADNDKTAFIPSGTYKISETIKLENQSHVGKSSCADNTGKGAVAIFGDPVSRPVFKLVSGTFTNVSSPKPVLKIWRQSNKSGDPIGVERTACSYFAVIRDIDFNLQNNAGASGIDFGAAQQTYMVNIHVTGSNFHSGFMGLPGANQANVNLKVTGGRYGIWMNGALAEGTTLTGITLDGQSISAIYIKGGTFRGSTFVGLDVRNCGGVAVDNDSYSSGNVGSSGHLTLVDCRIELTNASNYAINRNDKAITLLNVFVKGTNNIVTGAGKNYSSGSPSSNWTRIKQYTYTPNTVPNDNGTVYGYNVVNGVKTGGGDEIKDVVSNASAPVAETVSRHIPTTGGTSNVLYSHKSSGMVNFLNYKNSGNSYAQALQAALNSSASKVFIPAGDYLIDQLITVPAGKALIGVPGYRSELRPDYNALGLTSRSWLLTTQNSNAFTVLQDIQVNTVDQAYLGPLHWRSSEGIVFGVNNYEGAGHSEQNKHYYKFSGTAGGKVYGISDQNNLITGAVADPNFRKVYIENTSNPLTFYGLNLERGGFPRNSTQYSFFEAKNSSNFRVFGCKTETWGTVFTMDNCSNFMLTNVMANKTNDEPMIIISANSTDFAVTKVVVTTGNYPGTKLLEDGSVTTANEINRPNLLSWHSKGSFDNSVFNGIAAPSQTAYMAHAIPGKIEGEHYDYGGQGIAFNDDGSKDGDQAFRPGDNVDIGNKPAASNGYSVGWSNQGEWLEYTVSSVAAGTYDIVFSYSSGSSSPGDLKVSLDGAELTTFTGITGSGGWSSYTTATASNIQVPGGSDMVLRLEYVNGGGFDIDAIEFVASGSWNLFYVDAIGKDNTSSSRKQIANNTDEWPGAVNIYPNPNHGEFQVTGLGEADQLHLVSVSGRRIDLQATAVGDGVSVRATGSSPGVYTLVVQGRDNISTHRFIIR